MNQAVAVIIGAGPGLSAALARRCARECMAVALAARDTSKLAELCRETGALAITCDAADPAQVQDLFEQIDARLGAVELCVYNAGYRYRGALAELEPRRVERALQVSAFGGFLAAQQAAARMLRAGRGTIVFTGATASVKGYAQSTPFAMGKFALRGLAQCLARELAPQGIHVAHVVIDGGIATTYAKTEEDRNVDRFLDADAIAAAYWQLHQQHRSAWTWEIELRPWLEKF